MTARVRMTRLLGITAKKQTGAGMTVIEQGIYEERAKASQK